MSQLSQWPRKRDIRSWAIPQVPKIPQIRVFKDDKELWTSTKNTKNLKLKWYSLATRLKCSFGTWHSPRRILAVDPRFLGECLRPSQAISGPRQHDETWRNDETNQARHWPSNRKRSAAAKPPWRWNPRNMQCIIAVSCRHVARGYSSIRYIGCSSDHCDETDYRKTWSWVSWD
jgi:hypothetical protein